MLHLSVGSMGGACVGQTCGTIATVEHMVVEALVLGSPTHVGGCWWLVCCLLWALRVTLRRQRSNFFQVINTVEEEQKCNEKLLCCILRWQPICRCVSQCSGHRCGFILVCLDQKCVWWSGNSGMHSTIQLVLGCMLGPGKIRSRAICRCGNSIMIWAIVWPNMYFSMQASISSQFTNNMTAQCGVLNGMIAIHEQYSPCELLAWYYM